MGEFDQKRVWGPKPSYTHVLAAKGGGNGELIVVAGPCSIETPEQAEIIGKELARHRVSYMRGGIFRAGTYPGEMFGMQKALFERYAGIAHYLGLKIIVEVIDLRDLPHLDPYTDAFQIGARHMQDYALLHELSQSKKPVLLKRNMGATLDEFLGAAEYLCRGSCQPILVERGSSTHMNHIRWDLSISLIAAIKRLTALPILVDASHGTGRRDLVEAMTLAGIAAGADGFVVEVHPEPASSISDADQAYPLMEFGGLLAKAKRIKEALR